MTTAYSEKPIDCYAQPDRIAATEVTAEIIRRGGQRLILIKERHGAEPLAKAEQVFELPAAGLPDLKRALVLLEENFGRYTEDEQWIYKSDERCRDILTDPSEEEFARTLDFYHIAWRHKPRTFAVEWDDEGNFVGSFTPAFYLPDQDQYIELTTSQQKCAAERSRKVRLLRQSYPEVRIILLGGTGYHKVIGKCAASGEWQGHAETACV